MIECTTCHAKDFEGALFCSNCGASLGFSYKSPTVTNHFSAHEPVPEPQPLEAKPPSTHKNSAWASLKIIDNGQIIPLESSHELTLGRVSGNQPILPDIDLTPFQAYEGGVSRLHATIRLDSGKVFITDLGSANGTRINGKKMAAHSIQEIADGDMISLGKFRIQLLIHKSNE
jgi:hypothetical protein